MYRILNKFIASIVLVAFLILPGNIQAASIGYDILAPDTTLTRGQDVAFTLKIDTRGAAITSGQVGVSYDTKVLQYINTSPGDAMTAVTAQDQGGGKLVITGSSPSGYTGSGVLAYINFKLIANAPGASELCTLFSPSSAPTAAPTQATQTTPLPTRLPTTGNADTATASAVIGVVLLAGAGYILLRPRYDYTKIKSHKGTHKNTP